MENDRILGYFLEEASEHLNTIEQGLSRLAETVRQPATIRELFRAAHSIKGSAAMLGLTDVQQVGNQFEANFKLLKDCPQIAVDYHLQSLFLQSFSFLKAAIAEVSTSADPYRRHPQTLDPVGDPVFEELKAYLQESIERTVRPSATEQASGESLPAADLERVFGEYVSRKLGEVANLCLQSDRPEVRAEIQQICQKLGNLGENFEFLEWSNLFAACRLAIADRHNTLPQLGESMTIAIKQAQVQVLSGRAREIAIPADLAALIEPGQRAMPLSAPDERDDTFKVDNPHDPYAQRSAQPVSATERVPQSQSSVFTTITSTINPVTHTAAKSEPDPEFFAAGTWMHDDDFADSTIVAGDLELAGDRLSLDYLSVDVGEYDEETFYNPEAGNLDLDLPNFWSEALSAAAPSPAIIQPNDLGERFQPDAPAVDLNISAPEFGLDPQMSDLFPSYTSDPADEALELEDLPAISAELTAPAASEHVEPAINELPPLSATVAPDTSDNISAPQSDDWNSGILCLEELHPPQPVATDVEHQVESAAMPVDDAKAIDFATLDGTTSDSSLAAVDVGNSNGGSDPYIELAATDRVTERDLEAQFIALDGSTIGGESEGIDFDSFDWVTDAETASAVAPIGELDLTATNLAAPESARSSDLHNIEEFELTIDQSDISAADFDEVAVEELGVIDLGSISDDSNAIADRIAPLTVEDNDAAEEIGALDLGFLNEDSNATAYSIAEGAISLELERDLFTNVQPTATAAEELHDLFGEPQMVSGSSAADEMGDLDLGSIAPAANGDLSALALDLDLGADASSDLELPKMLDATPAAMSDLGDLDDLLGGVGGEPIAAPGAFNELDDLLGAPAPIASADPNLDDLDALVAAPVVNEPAATTADKKTTDRRAKQRTFEQTMRVSVRHLDNLSNLVGELVVNRNTLEQDQNRMRQFVEKLLSEVQKLNEVGKRMQDLYERSLMENSLLASRQQHKPTALPNPAILQDLEQTGTLMEYDPLEMDRFTPIHLLSQKMIELTVRIRESTADIEFVVDGSTEVTRTLRQITGQLQEDLTKSRMIPFAQTADRLQRGVRDNGLKYGKQVELSVEGRDTLIDKVILESLTDPLIHMVNNAIAHGIESAQVRQAAGKPIEGKITIRALHQGNQTIISISDDGAGIDTERVKAKAIEKGIITASQAAVMSKTDAYELLFLPSFSTKDQADELAGRGVGMDVVRNSLTEIRGTIITESQLGVGTTFTIRLPLALSIAKAIIAVNNKTNIAFPLDGIEDTQDVSLEQIQTNQAGEQCIFWRDELMPFKPIGDLLGFNRPLPRNNFYTNQDDDSDLISILILRSDGNLTAVRVDKVIGEREIAIKPLQGPAAKPLGIAGATVLGDGRIVPIADVMELVALAKGSLVRPVVTQWNEGMAPAIVERRESMVLIVDDSITVRELLSLTFKRAGYRVEQARDGQEAWDKLRAGLPCDIVFCDIEMPRMDGLEFLSRVQKDLALKKLPVAMLTSRGSDRHRQIASQLGASGYFIKPYLEEALLDAAKRMIEGEVLAIV